MSFVNESGHHDSTNESITPTTLSLLETVNNNLFSADPRAEESFNRAIVELANQECLMVNHVQDLTLYFIAWRKATDIDSRNVIIERARNTFALIKSHLDDNNLWVQ